MRERRDGSDHLPDLRGDLHTSKNLVSRPARWPHFSSTLRSTAVTARLGRVLGIAVGICFLTGLLSYYQYLPWSWLPNPASPVWGYRFTQGLHVATGTAIIPLLLIKLWSVYPNVFRWPPFPSVPRVLERISLALLVSSALIQVVAGFLRVLNWYAVPVGFRHRPPGAGLRTGRLGPAACRDQAARHPLRVADQDRRGRCVDRDPLERESRVAQQRGSAAAADHAGNQSAGTAHRHRSRPRASS